jgi:hypothetical protein
MDSNVLSIVVVASLAPSLAAQDVTTVLKGTTLTIKGSAGVDDLSITAAGTLVEGAGPAPVDILVTPGKGTSLDGSTDPATFPGVLQLKINLGNGADLLDVTDLDFGENPLTLNAGPGNDQVTLDNVTAGAFKFIGAAGDDTLDLASCTFGASKVIGASGILSMPATSTYFHDLTLKGGPVTDMVTWTDVTVDFNFKPNVAGGNDVVTLVGCTVGSTVTFLLGGGNDHFTNDDCGYGEYVNVVAGAGDDEVVLEDSLIGNDLNAKLGAGLNQLTLLAEDGSMIVGNYAVISGGALLDALEMRALAGFGSVIIGNDLIVALKSGANDLELVGNVDVGNDFFYTGGKLDDLIDMNEAQVGNDCTLTLAAGFNAAILTDCLIGNDLRITAGDGDDIVQLNGDMTIGGNTLISLGGGNNQGP